mmetsp:Transcript_36878/g.73549  ORF Transcript_36878/g.73549 Transcript_36878/m.73549 type:complete len:171 (-) Transcript_36878:225-737(-)
MSCSYDSSSRLVWWVDIANLDRSRIKSITVEDTFRAFVWLAHVIMYDTNAQANGLCFCETLGTKLGFFAMMTLVPVSLGVKLDRLTIGVLPVKMKLLLLLEAPTWISMLMKAFSMFMSKKMKGRVKVAKAEWHLVEENFGADKANVPKGFGQCGGTLAQDPVTSVYAGGG